MLGLLGCLFPERGFGLVRQVLRANPLRFDMELVDQHADDGLKRHATRRHATRRDVEGMKVNGSFGDASTRAFRVAEMWTCGWFGPPKPAPGCQ